MDKDGLLAVVRILKERFNSLTAEELIVLATKMLESLESVERKQSGGKDKL